MKLEFLYSSTIILNGWLTNFNVKGFPEDANAV